MTSRTLIVGLFFPILACSRAPQPTSTRSSVEARPTSPRSPETLQNALAYLGTAGWELSSSRGTLLVDPYYSRPNVQDDDMLVAPDEAVIARYAPKKVDAILVAHAHYDHLLDAPFVAARTGAVLFGTESAKNVALASGVAKDHVRVVHGGDSFRVGPFDVRAVAALHSLTGQKSVPIPSTVRVPLSAVGYSDATSLQYLVSFDGRSVFFVSSANFIEENVRGLRPDVAVVAVGLRAKIPDYTCRLVHALGDPKVVVANHFDAFTEPLRPGVLDADAETKRDLDAFVDEVHACAKDTNVVLPKHLRTIAL